MKNEFLIEEEWKEALSERSYELNHWQKREKFRKSISWHVPTKSLIDLLVSLSPIVSVGSGFAYTESLVKENGGEIVATDINPDENNKWCREGSFKMEVEELEAAAAVHKYSDRNVFMAWPPYDDPMAYEVVKKMKRQKYLVFIGEIGGCTGDEKFFSHLEKKFEKIETDAFVPSWSGIYDNVYVYKKTLHG